MSSTQENLQMQMIPSQPSVRLLDSDGSEKWFLASMMFVILTLWISFGKLGFLAGVALFGLMAFRYSMGRGYHLLGDLLQNIWIVYGKKGVLWEAPKNGSRHGRTGKRRKPPIIRLGIDHVQTSNGVLGLITQPDKKTGNFIVEGQGSNISSMSSNDQAAALQRIAEAIKAVATEVPYPIGVSYVWRRRPFDMTSLRGYILNNYHPDVVVPRADDKVSQAINKHQNELLSMVSVAAGKVTMAAIITVRQSIKWQAASRKKGKGLKVEDIDQAPTAQMAQRLTSDLRLAGIEGARTLGFSDVTRFFKEGWCVAGVDKYHELRYDGTIPQTDEEVVLDSSGQIKSDMQESPQEEICVEPKVFGSSWVKIDGTYISTIRIIRCPEYVLPTVFGRLYTTDADWRTVSLVGETMSGTRESYMLTMGISLNRAFNSAYPKTYETPKEAAARERLERRNFEQYHSGSILQVYNILLTVASTTEKGVKSDCDKVMSTLRSISGVKGKVMHGPNRQLPAALTAITGINHI